MTDYETPAHWHMEFVGWWRDRDERVGPFDKSSPRTVAHEAWMDACERRSRHLHEMQSARDRAEEEAERARRGWGLLHDRLTELEDAVRAVRRWEHTPQDWERVITLLDTPHPIAP